MSIPQMLQFEANLPGLSKPIRILTRNDAEVFTCRWTIRDRDPALKALLREMKSANSSATADVAIRRLKQALASRGLLVGAGP
jgi:rRNA-processing protein FCF1